MSDLRPCPQCRRHVRVDEASCPFCATALAAATPALLPVGRFTRAAVFAGAALVSACGGAASKPDAKNVSNTPEGVADAGAEAAPPDASPVIEKVPDHDIPMPYGAPPARRRLV